MKRFPVLIILFLPYVLAAQPRLKNKKYQSLLWEITGHGLKKPSYLFGTMHVSSKMAFHLADSFYLGIRNADMVALETNPESWQEDMSKYDLGGANGQSDYRFRMAGYTTAPDDYLRRETLKFFKYDKKVEQALYSNPSTINNLLYRSYGGGSSDFEEDTYLDMYIYQCGKKWGKKVAGVEKYGESMKLMAEAYKDAAKDKERKERSDNEENYSSNKLQEAYRSGNLDWLDSINKYNSFSTAFDEKFLYRRNDIQASSIDSILRSGQSLFVGVGAAHLPGSRGVIEILRRAGYTLRPVTMGARDSQHKNQVEKLRVPVSFSNQSADDGLFNVDIPGKFYKFGDDASMDQRQYADMANGSYYMVTRIMTNAWMWGHSTTRVNQVIDSLLYENIPGKIIHRSAIVRNGYPGIDLTNKTRRGDIQRYNIFTTPFEVIIFKMSGTGDYVSIGDEAQRFFGSIRFRENRPGTEWKRYSPPYGGFSVLMPHEAYVGNDGSWIFDAEDKAGNAQYRVIRSDIHNYRFVEEDTFDLGLLDESFAASDFIDRSVLRRQTSYKGYPALDCRYKDKNGGLYIVRFIIQGPHYYTLVAHGKQETPAMSQFFASFELTPFVYAQPRERRDTALYYSVMSPVFPVSEREKIDIPRYSYAEEEDDDKENTESDILEGGAWRSKIVANDSTGEKIYVSFFRSSRYTYVKDSLELDRNNTTSIFGDTSWITRLQKKMVLPNGTRIWESIVTDTGSSRTLWTKTFLRDGIGCTLITESDTLSTPSSFVRSFYDSFTPADTLKGIDLYRKKSDLFFADFLSSDSVAHHRAVKTAYAITFDSLDLPQLKKAIASVNWKEKRYLDVKKSLIGKLDDIRTRQASDYLQDLYHAAGDTLELQYASLEVLLQQKTAYAYSIFRDMVTADPPVLNVSNTNSWNSYRSGSALLNRSGSYDNGSFLDELDDSLQLTRSILPGLLPLVNLDDYKRPLMRLLGKLVDSNLVKAADYEAYSGKFLIEAKQEMKKQIIAEKQKAIKHAEEKKTANKNTPLRDDDEDNDYGNDNLQLYATILMPYWDNTPAIPVLVKQMLQSNDKRVKYAAMLLLLRNKRNCPDSVLTYFAGLDDYRYELYADLSRIGQMKRFPVNQLNPIELAKSKLFMNATNKPDSLLYAGSLPAAVKDRSGRIYFFRYKNKKDDALWKIATVGLEPSDSTAFELPGQLGRERPDYYLGDNFREVNRYDFTGFTATKIRDEESLMNQLRKELKRQVFSKRRSAAEFYGTDNGNNDDGSDDSDDGDD